MEVELSSIVDISNYMQYFSDTCTTFRVSFDEMQQPYLCCCDHAVVGFSARSLAYVGAEVDFALQRPWMSCR